MTLDDRIILFFNGHHSPMMDSLMVALTERDTWIPFYLLLIVLMIWRLGWKKGLVMIAGCFIAVGIADFLCASVIRPAVARPRPPLSDIGSLLTLTIPAPHSYSFPSCHAANTFAATVFLCLAYKRRWFSILVAAWAVIHTFTRLYLALHFPSDLLVGAAIGCIIGGLTYIVFVTASRRWLAVALLAVVSCEASATERVKMEWGGEFTSVFDNREGDDHITPSQTFFFTRLAPEIGLSVNHGQHRVMGGAVWTQPIGCEWDGHRISPVIYYRYHRRSVTGYMGMFPRTSLIEPLPDYLESDSTRYSQYTIRGAMVQCQGKHGYVEALVDWRGMRGEHRREAFGLIVRGRWQHKWAQAGGLAMLNHLAKQYNPPPGQDVVDNVVVNPFVALDFRHWLPSLNEFRLECGPIATITRDRNDMQWITAMGIRSKLSVSWWRIGLDNIFTWADKPLYPLWNRFGAALSDGEPYYSARCYNRTEVYGILAKYRDIAKLRAELDFHVGPGDFMFYQRLILTINI